MSPASPRDSALPEPEPALLWRILSTLMACAVAAGVFVWVAGCLPGARPLDDRLAVAACWDAIEQRQPAGDQAHDMRVACQRMEHETGRQAGQLVAAGE